jgi:putative ABC transport system substrate-binding protein
MTIERTVLIVAFVLGFVACSLSAVAQQPAQMPRVGILSDETHPIAAKSSKQFAQGLRDLGYVEGRNITFEHRYAEGRNEILPKLAAELVSLQPDVILAVSTPAARAAKFATQSTPIVFARVSDPVGSGLVSSLARPGGNVTGLSILARETDAKRLEMLVTAVPDAKRAGVLWNPSNPVSPPELNETETAARSLQLELVAAEVRGPDDVEPALHSMVEQRVGALIVIPGLILTEHSLRLVDLTTKARLPTMFLQREYVEAGGLMSYWPNLRDMYRRAAAYVDKILRGAKPADIPVEQPTRFELVINLKTAKSLGLTIPPTLLARADEVIE